MSSAQSRFDAGEDRARFERRIESARLALTKRAARALDADETEDAVQETLTIALTKSEWRDILLPEHWVLGVLDYVILAAVSSTKHKTRPALLGLLDDMDAETGESDDPCEIALEAIAAAQELTAQIDAIKDALPRANLTDKERQALVGRLCKKSDRALAHEMQMSLPSLRKYVSLAVAKLRPLLRADSLSAHL